MTTGTSVSACMISPSLPVDSGLRIIWAILGAGLNKVVVVVAVVLTKGKSSSTSVTVSPAYVSIITEYIYYKFYNALITLDIESPRVSVHFFGQKSI